MPKPITVPQHLVSSIAHGVKLAVSIIDDGHTTPDGKDLKFLAYDMEVTLAGHLRQGLTPTVAADLLAVLDEAAEYAFTCNYGEDDNFPEDYQFANQAEEILSFLQLALGVLV